MTATLLKFQPTASLPGDGLQHTQISVNHLRGLLKELTQLSKLRTSSERADRAVFESVRILRAAACIIESVAGEIADRSRILHCQAGVDPDDLRPVAAVLTAKVADAGNTLIVKNLNELFEYEGWLQRCNVLTYLGVPIFDSNGSVRAVAAVFGGKDRLFEEEEGSWLTVAGQLVGDSLACEALARELRTLKEQSHQSPGNGTVSQSESPDNSHQPTILVVDDDRMVNDMLCQFLAMEGYQVEHAYNGQEALEAFHPAKHDLVITDVAMPLMNGPELVALLRVRAPALPIILISGYGIGEFDQGYPSKQGVSAVLGKPLDLGEVAELVNSLTKISA
jgi:CheY-like chemotaxis protein